MSWHFVLSLWAALSFPIALSVGPRLRLLTTGEPGGLNE
jgi:hypothetical protein